MAHKQVCLCGLVQGGLKSGDEVQRKPLDEAYGIY